MVPMPKGIVKGGKDDLKLQNPSLLVHQGFIDGVWTDAADKSTFVVENKATQAEIGKVANMKQADTCRAIEAAGAAFDTWSKTTAAFRAGLLTKLFQALEDNIDDLAKIITAENGKPLAEARGEMEYSNSYVEWFAGEARRTYGRTIPSPNASIRNVTLKQPIGVCALIAPWNFPSAMITRKVAPALAAGCTCVIKPPGETPYSALAFAHLAERVGIPRGVINVVPCEKGPGDIVVGKELCENPIVKKLSFTGSTRVGKILMSQCSATVKKLSFELGGNAPFIVFEDADVDKAVDAAIQCKFRNAGQTCVCANRILVHEKIYDDFTDKLAKRVSAFKVGNGLDSGVTMGPLVNAAGQDKTETHVKESEKLGAKVIVGGKRGEGLFFEPTVLADVPYDSPIFDEETFGPLAALFKFSSEEEVITQVNKASVGLASYFFSQDVARCLRVGERLEAGMVGINTGLISQSCVPFGGVKESGFGREGGPSGIDEYMVDKLLVFGL